MDDKIIVAIVAAASAVAGGLITGIVSPFVKHRLEQATADKVRKRDQIARWRQMLLEVHVASEGSISPGEVLHLHAEYISLEPFLTKEARTIVRSENRTIVLGQALSEPLEALKGEIARIESAWGLRD